MFNNAGIVMGGPFEEADDRAPVSKISPDKAAAHILAGVARNRPVISFPFSNSVILRAYSLFPGALRRFITTK